MLFDRLPVKYLGLYNSKTETTRSLGAKRKDKINEDERKI